MANHQIDTAAARKRLPERREPYWLKVSDKTGLFIGFRKGSDTWVARMRDEEKSPTAQKYKSLGRFADHRDAIREAKKWAKGLEAGISDDRKTIADAAHAYLDYLNVEKGVDSFKEQRARLQRVLIGRTPREATAQRCRPVKPHRLANRRLSKLHHVDLLNWRKGLLAPGLKDERLRQAKASCNRDLAAVIAMLNYAKEEKLVLSDQAWSGLKKYKNVGIKSSARRYVSLKERRELVAAADGPVKDLLRGLCLLGCRPIELTRCKVSDYDPIAATLTVRSFKGGVLKERELPLRTLGAAVLIKKLARNKLPTAVLFARADGSGWPHSGWDHEVRAAVKRAGLKKLTAYSLRHSWIDDCIKSGIDPMTTSKIAGTSIQMIDKSYGNLIDDHAEQVFQKVKLL